MKRALLVCGLGVFLSGCNETAQYGDLAAYMDDVRASSRRGEIEKTPSFVEYEAFIYSASGLRSPFQPPIKVTAVREQRVISDIKPDFDRVKQYLENYSFDAFKMVGTLSNPDGFWGLLSTDGTVFRVRVGDYMGKNHGRIIGITDTEIQVIEVVSSGPDSWVERPRTVGLREREF